MYVGFARKYLEKLPKYVYSGQMDALPKLAKCVASEKNIYGTRTRSLFEGSSLLKASCALSMRGDVYTSP